MTRLLILTLCLPWLAARPLAAETASDPGIAFEIDLGRHVLWVRDVRSGESFGALRVAVGSPAHPTPRGRFRLGRAVLSPAWTPGSAARAAGAQPAPPSIESPMGVAKLPFAEAGAIALHGGGDPYVLGKPVSSGCVRASDAGMLRLLAWLHLRGALAPAVHNALGERQRDFQRPARLHVH